MSKTIIKKFSKTGEFCAIVDFNKKEVDWNMIAHHMRSGCHCIWVESDLESYVKVYGHEVSCVRKVLDDVESIVKLEL